jgi:hypothetical protein
MPSHPCPPQLNTGTTWGSSVAYELTVSQVGPASTAHLSFISSLPPSLPYLFPFGFSPLPPLLYLLSLTSSPLHPLPNILSLTSSPLHPLLYILYPNPTILLSLPYLLSFTSLPHLLSILSASQGRRGQYTSLDVKKNRFDGTLGSVYLQYSAPLNAFVEANEADAIKDLSEGQPKLVKKKI